MEFTGRPFSQSLYFTEQCICVGPGVKEVWLLKKHYIYIVSEGLEA